MTATLRRRIAVPAMLASLLVALAFAGSASATPLIGSVFDSQDGDQLTGPGIGIKDWQDVATAARLTTNLDNQAVDDCFIGGNKEDTPSAWNFNVSSGGCTPGKSDLLGMWSQAELTSTASILHAAFVRNAPTGNTFITFELNQVGTTWTNSVGAPIPCRSTGDLLLAYDIGGGSVVSVTIYRWAGDGTGPGACPDGASGTFTSSTAANNGLINAAAIANDLSPATIGATIGANLFGEAQIDVASVLASMTPDVTCFSYIQAQAHTRSSSSISSALIDNVKPVPTKVANCGVTGTVFGDANDSGVRDAGETGSAGRTVYVDLDSDGSLDPLEPFAITDAEGTYLIATGLSAGTYPIRVVVPAGVICTTPAGCAFSDTFTAAGDNSVANDFGLYVPATVSGTAYVDTNANAVRDAGESTPIAGRTIFNDANGNGVLDAGESSTTTAADGSYTVGGLAPGTTRIRFVNGGGYVCDLPAGCLHTLAVASGDTPAGRDFLAYQPPTVGGTVYDDADADAIHDGGEGGHAAVVVGLYAADGTTLLATTTTDASGTYAFSTTQYPAFKPGAYVVKVTPPGGLQCSAPCATAITLTSGQNLTGQTTGVYANATVAGTVFTDNDVDGAKGPLELGAGGKAVYGDTNDNGGLDAGETSTTTLPDGTYALSLRPGAVHIRSVLTGSDVCSGPSPCRHDLTLTSGASFSQRDFGIYTPSVVTGVVYADVDGDGTKAGVEPGLAGRTVFADYDGDTTIDAGEPSTTTVAGGAYTLGGVRPGLTLVRVITSGADSCTTPTSCLVAHAFLSGGTFGADFGIWLPASVSGTVYEDSNANGALGGSEPGLGARIVFDDANDNGAPDGGEPQTTTAGDGTYTLPGLAPGMHRVRATLPAGFTRSEPAGPAGAHVLTLTSGQSVTARNFGGFRDATVRGHVFQDTDGDHVHQGGEPALGGQAVRLYAADGTTELASTTTDGTGLYEFAGLIPAGYVVRPGLGGGYVCSSPAPCNQTLTVVSGQTAGGQDFTAYEPATVSGTAYTDSDNDAIQDPGEPVKAGVVIYADIDDDGVADAGEPSATTDALGGYTVAGIAPGAVHVRADLAAGFACSTPSGCDHALTLTSGESEPGRDFGIVQGAIASGTVAIDNDADGTVDASEPPLSGWTVYVDANANGQPDTGEPSDVTAADGGYTIANVTPGPRTLRVDRPAGWTCGSPCSRSVAFTSGDTTSGLDFALYQPVTVGGTVFEDQDADGTKDAGDAGIAGRIVFLDLDANDELDGGEPTATTDADGDYAFGGLAPGTRHVRTFMPAGWTCSAPAPCEHTLALASGESADGDFGSYRDVTVAGRIYADDDADGARDGGEPGLPGRTVHLDLDGNGTQDAGEPTATTDAAGDYAFAGLRPGGYTVRLVLDLGEHCTGGCFASVTPTSGETGGAQLGAWTDATVSGTVFADDDADGVADSGDGPRVGETVYADLDGDGSRDAGEPTATTDAAGGYALDLQPGTYTIRIDTPAGEQCSICSHAVTLTSGQPAGGRDFGLYEQATVTGRVIDDTDADGGPEAAEPGLAGRTVWADLDGDGTPGAGEPSTTTDAAGDYALAGLEPGSYTIRVELPAGWHCSPVCAAGVTVGSGDTPALDFAQWREVTIGGTVYGDADGSASRDPGEDGLSGHTIELDRGADGTVDDTTTTAADGSYAFAGLMPGSVRITVVPPAGWTCSTPSPCRFDGTPASGAVSSANHFGLFRPDVADLSLTKSAPTTVDQGDTFAYVLTVTNSGPDAAQNAVVADALPGGVQFVSAGAGCVEVAGTVTCSLGTIAGGASATRSITVRAVDAGNVANSATVSSDTGDPTPENNTDGADVDVTPVADVSIAKTGPASVAAGTNATYTLTASNAGPSTAHGVVVADTLPAGMTFVSLASPGGVSCTTPAAGAGGNVQCTAATLADGASIVLTLVAKAGFAAAEQTLTNTATVHADELDHDAANDSASAQTAVGPASDVRLAKTASVSALPQNHQLTYTLTATNDGPSAATNVVVGDPLPAGVSFVSASAGCVQAAGAVTCALGTLADGASASATITVTATANGDRVNTATVSSDNPDPDSSDNAGSVTVLVGPTADLSIAKTGPATVTAGGELTYTLTAANHGPSPATGVTVTDELPAGMAYVSSTASQGGCAAAGQTVTCAVGSLADGASATMTVTARASFAIAGQTAINSATIAGDQNDDDAADDSAVHPVNVGPAADLTFVKDAPAHVPAGGQLVYSLRVANAGPQTATDVVISDTLPAGVRFASATSTQGACAAAGQTVTCTIGSVPVGGGAQVVLTVDVDAAGGGRSLHNAALASSDTTEVDPSTNGDDATTAVDAVPAAAEGRAPAPAGTLTVTKTADAGADASAPLGSPVAFTIRVANDSAGTAHGVVAIDQPSAPSSVGSVLPDRGTCSDLRCELGDLVPGDVVLIHVVMTPRRTGTLTNAVTVFADDGGAVKDDVANVQVVAHKTNLRLTKTASLRSVGAGKTVWYTITAKNVGRYAAANLRVCDMPAPRTAYVSVRGAKFSGGRPCWKVKLLMPGKSVSFRVKVRVFEGSQGPMSRTRASVSASNASPRRAVRTVRVVGRRAVRAGGVTG